MTTTDATVAVQCPSCGGLRGVAARHAERNGDLCRDFKSGQVVTREEFDAFWLERFSREELREMARAIWPG